jgi:outer membrane protein assembly factor BamB
VQSKIFIASLIVLGTVALPGVGTADWPQWRGPARDSSVGGPDWPASFDSMELSWRVPLDRGYPGPIVSASRVFVAETRDRDTEVVRALDRQTGAELWSVSWPGEGKVPFFARRNGDWIRSTPAFDGESLYVGGMREVLVSLDAETGRENWRVDFPQRFGTPIPAFGFASSPLVDGDAVYVQAADSVVKLDKRTGETLWRSLAIDSSIFNSGAFSSPVIATVHGRRQLVVQTRETLYGVALEDGEALWSQDVPHFRGMNILTPMVVGDSVLTSTYKNRTFLYDLAEQGGRVTPREAWSYKSPGYMSSPVVVDGYAYLHLGSGRLTCLDLATGEATWTTRPMGDYWSMVVQGDKILALSDEGMLYLMRANPEAFELLDARQISDQSTWAHLAVSGDAIFVRQLEGLIAYRWGQRERFAERSAASSGEVTRIEEEARSKR